MNKRLGACEGFRRKRRRYHPSMVSESRFALMVPAKAFQSLANRFSWSCQVVCVMVLEIQPMPNITIPQMQGNCMINQSVGFASSKDFARNAKSATRQEAVKRWTPALFISLLGFFLAGIMPAEASQGCSFLNRVALTDDIAMINQQIIASKFDIGDEVTINCITNSNSNLVYVLNIDKNYTVAQGVVSFNFALTAIDVAGRIAIRFDKIEDAGSSMAVITCKPVNPFSVTVKSSAVHRVGQPYLQSTVVTGGVPFYVFGISGGRLPQGTTLNTSTGVVSGIPLHRGYFAYTIMVRDNSLGSPQVVKRTVSGAIQ